MKKSILSAALALAATAAYAAEPVVVASKIDTEGGLLGQFLVQTLQAHDVDLVDKTELGTTNILREALVSGEIDVYPEYTGNGAFFTETADDQRWRNADEGYAFIKEADEKDHQLVWLKPAPANNTWGIAVNDALFQQGVSDFDALKQYLADGGELKLAASAEFIDSPVALPAFQDTYGFELNDDQLLVLSGGNTAATIRAAAMGTNGVNAAMVYGTDGAIAAANLHVLKDQKGAQSVYAPAAVVRASVLEAYPQLPEIIEPVFATLDDETLQELNSKIQVEGLSAQQVAADYLKEKGLID
ncbi:hypothetical protein KRX19_06985 [Cardiobacteriaceae bacterium TAE3-ERU3]|nr:hypothetical protein [Cardiobacteriaceae bacterium TAE3-ERU3]